MKAEKRRYFIRLQRGVLSVILDPAEKEKYQYKGKTYEKILKAPRRVLINSSLTSHQAMDNKTFNGIPWQKMTLPQYFDLEDWEFAIVCDALLNNRRLAGYYDKGSPDIGQDGKIPIQFEIFQISQIDRDVITRAVEGNFGEEVEEVEEEA